MSCRVWDTVVRNIGSPGPSLRLRRSGKGRSGQLVCADFDQLSPQLVASWAATITKPSQIVVWDVDSATLDRPGSQSLRRKVVTREDLHHSLMISCQDIKCLEANGSRYRRQAGGLK